ncbi:MAG: carboxypeptidase-like regulatory domain-containing protein [Candidatus Woesearchaeota archaeon]
MKAIAIIAMFFLMLGFVNAAPTTMVYGQVTDSSNNPVSGASVSVDCNGNILNTVTDASGMYYVFYPALLCNVGDTAIVTVNYGDQTFTGTGTVDYSKECRINVGVVNVQIPEFGVIAAGLALIGAIAIFAIRRK